MSKLDGIIKIQGTLQNLTCVKFDPSETFATKTVSFFIATKILPQKVWQVPCDLTICHI